MRTLRRNKQMLYYSLQSSEKQPIYETDDDGNIVYYEDDEGNQIPIETGEYEYTYSTPVSFLTNISMGGSDTQQEVYGVDMSSYDATLLVERDSLPIDETSLIWFETEPTYKDDGKTILDEQTADYTVVKIVDSLNFTTVVLKKRVK